MHPGNMFIHWLNKNSYMHDQYIGNVEYIYYGIANKYYKIKTFGAILKISDVGSSIVHPRSDLYIVGEGNDLEKTNGIVQTITKFPQYYNFLHAIARILPVDIFDQTIIHQIRSSYPFNKMAGSIAMTDTIVNDIPSTGDIMRFNDKYLVEDIRTNKNVLIVNMN